MLQQKNPEDFVIASGKNYSVRDFINIAAKFCDMEITWKGKNLNERGYYNGKEIIKIDPRYFRPTEVNELLGDATKAKKNLKWQPKISFEELVNEMINEDLKLAKNDSTSY